jgi:hypothetical protein
MLLGVLRMPPELWTDSPIDVQQRHARYMQAAAHIECATLEIEYLQAELAEARRDAERYQWVKSRAGGEITLKQFTAKNSGCLKHGFSTPEAVRSAKTADAAIDAARKETP